jgi:hypothetical protein
MAERHYSGFHFFDDLGGCGKCTTYSVWMSNKQPISHWCSAAFGLHVASSGGMGEAKLAHDYNHPMHARVLYPGRLFWIVDCLTRSGNPAECMSGYMVAEGAKAKCWLLQPRPQEVRPHHQAQDDLSPGHNLTRRMPVGYHLMRLRHRVAAGWSGLEPGGSGYDDQPRGGT